MKIDAAQEAADSKQQAAEGAKLVPGTPEYDAEMVRVAKAARGEAEDSAQNTNQDPAKSPDGGSESDQLILGKFKTQDDLLKAYQELEKRLGAGQQEQPKAPGQAKPQEQPKADAQQIAGIPVESLQEEVTKSGDLSADTRAKLTQAGIPNEYIDSYLSMYKVAAQAEQASVQAAEAQIKQAVGGEETYTKMVQWASTNLTAGEIDAFNRQIEAGPDAAKLAVFGLKARYESKVGKAPRLVSGSSAGGSADVFADKASFLEAMADQRYRTSESYRNQVTAKLERTRASGVSW